MRRMFVIGMTTVFLAVPGAFAVAEEEVEPVDPAEETEIVEISAAQTRKALLIATQFAAGANDTVEGDDSVSEPVDEVLETVLELRRQTGWGAVYKLMLLAEAGVEIDELDGAWGFGKQFKGLAEEQAELIADAPKNLGQLKKQEREAADGDPELNRGQVKKQNREAAKTDGKGNRAKGKKNG